MALPTSGNISLLDIKGEFGGDGALTSYYRGGSLVPNTAANAGVPTSGSISVRDFLGASKSVVQLTDRTITHSPGISGTTGRAGIQLSLSGFPNQAYEIRGTTNSRTDITGEWLLSGSAADYEKRATIISGPTPGGVSGGNQSYGTWVAGNTEAQWWNQNSISTTISTLVVRVEVREVATGTIVATADFTLEAKRG